MPTASPWENVDVFGSQSKWVSSLTNLRGSDRTLDRAQLGHSCRSCPRTSTCTQRSYPVSCLLSTMDWLFTSFSIFGHKPCHELKTNALSIQSAQCDIHRTKIDVPTMLYLIFPFRLEPSHGIGTPEAFRGWLRAQVRERYCSKQVNFTVVFSNARKNKTPPGL